MRDGRTEEGGPGWRALGGVSLGVLSHSGNSVPLVDNLLFALSELSQPALLVEED